jgi:hypothetical protein
VRSLVLVMLVALGSCDSGSAVQDSCRDGAVAEDGPCLEDVGLYYQPCSGKVVAVIPAGDCPGKGCGASSAYAVCNGKEWIPCSCSIPPGYTLVDAGFFGPEGGSEVGM